MSDQSGRIGNDIRIDADIRGRARDIVGEQYIGRPTMAREKRELRRWQADHLIEAIPAYAGEQQRLKEILADPPPLESPFKGLNYFNPLDQAIFHGREAIADKLVERILQTRNRLTVLHAPSGAGKTSLIRAGLIPRLLKEDHYFLWTTTHPYPDNVYEPVTGAIGFGPTYDDLPLQNFLKMVTRSLAMPSDTYLVVFLDQFERVFSSGNDETIAQVQRDLDACLRATDETLPVRLMISIRWDFLGPLDQIPVIRERLGPKQRFMLDPLDQQQALSAITKPLEGWPVAWEDGAAENVLDYLAKGEIEPPHLQLICMQLYEKAIEEERTHIRCQDVDEHDLEKLHRQYLRNEMARLTEGEIGWSLLKTLVDSQGVARPRLLEEIDKELGSESIRVVETLVDRRVLRRERERGKPQIVISHETLGQEILAHESPQEIRVKAARELINRGLNDWLSHESRPLLGSARLRILDEYSDVLEPPILGKGTAEKEKREQKALEYLLRSALAEEHKAAHWYDLAQQGGLNAEAILLERLKSDHYKERAATLNVYGQIGKEEHVSLLIERLADEYPQVRAATIQALETLQPSGEWRKHLVHECYVPGGEFMMGNDNRESDEKPAHPVTVDAFYIAKTPVTNADYKRYADERGVGFDRPEGKANHPVVQVSWYQASEYAHWARMRLPTEAQWEKAASWDEKKGTKRTYPWGDDFDQNRCNTIESDIGGTTPVDHYGKKGASPCGAWDMAGNVREWCSSLQKGYPYDPKDGRENPSDSGSRVQRGGSCDLDASHARCAARYSYPPDGRWHYYGFRVCVVGASPISRSGS